MWERPPHCSLDHEEKQMTTKPWWMTDTYSIDSPLPDSFVGLEGPHDIATVAVNANGTTQQGWGLLGKKLPDGSREPGFMPRYPRSELNHRKTMWRYNKSRLPFAFVMRSLRVVAVDIDGKNGGFLGAQQLGELPETLAETSKSGNGFHLFYCTDEPWDPDKGFALFDDHIGIVPGVDIRATGCVFHYSTQRWNGRDIVPIPPQLAQLLQQKKQYRMTTTDTTTSTDDMDEVDRLVTQHTLLEDLAKPIPQGKRNNTFFALGSKMKAAGIEDWSQRIHDRADQLGLDIAETEKLVSNIATYGE